MIALGIVLLVLGAAGAIFGVVVNSDAEMRLYALFEYGNTDPGTIFIVAGALVAALGLVFLILGLLRRPAPGGAVPSATRLAPSATRLAPSAPRPAPSAPRPVPAASGPVCPVCGEALEKGSVFCNACGAKIDAAPRPTPSAPRPAPAARGPVCPVCGEALEEGSGFCSACGAKLDSASAPRPEPVTRPEYSAPRPVTPVSHPEFSAPRPVTPVTHPEFSAPRPVTPVTRPAASAPRPMGADPDATIAAEPAGRPVIGSFRPVTPSAPTKPELRKPSASRPVTPAAAPSGFSAPDDSDL